MRIILLDKVNNLGSIGQEVNVKSGYARNFLIPNSQAVLATKKNIALFQARRISIENHLKKIRSESEFYISEIKKIGLITIKSKSGVSGKLFGSIGAREIADVVVKLGIKISRYNVHLSNGRIRYLGNYDVIIKFQHDVFTTLNVCIVDAE